MALTLPSYLFCTNDNFSFIIFAWLKYMFTEFLSNSDSKLFMKLPVKDAVTGEGLSRAQNNIVTKSSLLNPSKMWQSPSIWGRH
jgi:hypothetical protein